MTQETLSTLWEKRDFIQGPDHLLPFVFRTLQFRIRNVLIQVQREQQRQGTEAELQDLSGDSPTAHPGNLTETRELNLIFGRAVEGRRW